MSHAKGGHLTDAIPLRVVGCPDCDAARQRWVLGHNAITSPWYVTSPLDGPAVKMYLLWSGRTRGHAAPIRKGRTQALIIEGGE